MITGYSNLSNSLKSKTGILKKKKMNNNIQMNNNKKNHKGIP